MPPANFPSDGTSPALHPTPGTRSPIVLGLLAVLLPGSLPLWALGLWSLEQQGARELPRYTLAITCVSGLSGLRLDSAAVLELTLRPATRVTGPVAVSTALLYDTGIEPWPIPLLSSASGTFWLRAPLQALPPLRPGVRQLVFLIGRPYDLPLGSTAPPSPGPQVQILRQPIELDR